MRYKSLADRLIDDVRMGRVQAGQKLPSLRQLAQQNEVSMTTALNCYRYLEEIGWVQARPQSGFYVRQPLTVGTLPELPTFASQATVPSTGGSSYSVLPGPLGITQLAAELQPVYGLERSLRRATRSQGRGYAFILMCKENYRYVVRLVSTLGAQDFTFKPQSL